LVLKNFTKKCPGGGGGFLFLSADDLKDRSRESSALLCANFERNFVLKGKKHFTESLQESGLVSWAVCLAALLLTAFRVTDPAFQKTTDTQFQLPKLDPLQGCGQNTNFILCPDACKTKIRAVAGLQVKHKMPAAGVILVGTLAAR